MVFLPVQNQDNFGHFSSSKDDSNDLDVNLRVFWKDEKNISYWYKIL